MSKKMLVLFLAASLVSLYPFSTQAEDSGISYPARIGGKFGIGLINTVTGIVEIPKSMMVVSEQEGIGMGMSLGFVKGMTNMLGRTLTGMVDVVSFPVPTKPMINPAVVFQDFDKETTYASGWETY
ncbi:MAG: exosortase system-associated protein, TIGR04073 family [Candidatus Methylumidiphilus sp.]